MKFANLSLNIHMHLDFYSHFLLRVSEFQIPKSRRTGFKVITSARQWSMFCPVVQPYQPQYTEENLQLT